eukprot:TRINITY_DN12449_c0_g1_i1.p1 TRINITY_DN12449_c0_g1~~TRINITY_DN12449_c0_g1_i1.p1  ORF type:complete len:661 (+),score=157.19 TRINITY_DN12449_c0_g1_i1:71-2053(+)
MEMLEGVSSASAAFVVPRQELPVDWLRQVPSASAGHRLRHAGLPQSQSGSRTVSQAEVGVLASAFGVVASASFVAGQRRRNKASGRRLQRCSAAAPDVVVSTPPPSSSTGSPSSGKKTAIVVGGGMAGLATAAQLAKGGVDVTLYEKNAEVGGRCQSKDSTKVQGYRWDTGPSLLLLPEKYRDAYKRTGSDLDEDLKLLRVEPAYRIVFGDDTHIDVDYDPMKFTESMEKFEPGCTSNYYRFLSVARRMLDMGVERFVDRQFEGYPDFLDPAGLLPPFFSKGWWNLPLIQMLFSIDDLMKGFFKDERLRAMFTFQTLYVGLTPYNSPGALCLLAGTDLTDGVWYPKGGWRGVRDTMTANAKTAGVKMQCNTSIDEVVVENGKATGVRFADGSTASADVVVVNADLPTAYRHLLRNADDKLRPEQKLESETKSPVNDASEEWLSRDYSCGVIAFYWAMDKKVGFLQHHSVFLGAPVAAEGAWTPICSPTDIVDRPNFYVHRPAVTDPSAAPANGDSIMVLFPVANLQQMIQGGKLKKGEKAPKNLYEDIRATARATILRRFEEAGMGKLEGHIVEEFVRDPVDWEELYGLEYGATFGLSHGLLPWQGGLAMTRPPNRAGELDGLFFVGAGTRPGNGVPLVLMGAGLTSQLILEEMGIKQPH